MRLAENGDLLGTNSPTLRHQISRIEANATSSASVQNRMTGTDSVDSPIASLRTVSLFKRNIQRITSLCSNRSRPTDQEKAIAFVIFFMMITIGCAAFIQTFLR